MVRFLAFINKALNCLAPQMENILVSFIQGIFCGRDSIIWLDSNQASYLVSRLLYSVVLHRSKEPGYFNLKVIVRNRVVLSVMHHHQNPSNRFKVTH